MEATAQIGDNPLFLFDYGLRLLRVAVLLALWRALFAGRGVVGGMTVESVLTYTVIAEAFRSQLECRGSGVDGALWDGSIATRFLRPLSIFSQFAAEMLGRWLFGFCWFSIPLLLLSPLLGANPGPAGPAAAGAFTLSLALGVSVGLALEFIFGAVVFLAKSVFAAAMVRDAAVTLFSGGLLPLALLPWGLGDALSWSPFAAMASTPLRIYTGAGEPLALLPLQAGWSLVLWLAAFYLWRARQERIVTYGG